ADQQGIFVVSTDGSPPRRLGPPSSQQSFAVFNASFVFQGSLIQFSPDSRRLAVVDNGPDGNGHDANQLWIIDLATGTRMQITRLPPPTEPTNLPRGSPTIGFLFQDNRTIGFSTAGNSGGAPPRFTKLFTVGTDGSGLREVDSPVATGGAILSIF